MQLLLVDAAQTEEVESNCKHHHKNAHKEKIVVINKGETEPRAARLVDALLAEIPEKQRKISLKLKCEAALSLNLLQLADKEAFQILQ